ncbi:MAG: phage holin family protein [Nocardioidaceae bacterium]
MGDPNTTTTTPGAATEHDPSTAELVTRLTQQSTELIRNELRLAQAEMTHKAKHAGVGAGLLGGAGVVALYGVGALVATVILALALVVPPWLAALIVTVVLFVIAGVVALVGKKQVTQATPAAPQQTIENVKQDVATIKGGQR